MLLCQCRSHNDLTVECCTLCWRVNRDRLSCCCCLSLSMIVMDRLGCSHLSIVLTLSYWCFRFLCRFVVVVNDEFCVVDDDDVVATSLVATIVVVDGDERSFLFLLSSGIVNRCKTRSIDDCCCCCCLCCGSGCTVQQDRDVDDDKTVVVSLLPFSSPCFVVRFNFNEQNFLLLSLSLFVLSARTFCLAALFCIGPQPLTTMT